MNIDQTCYCVNIVAVIWHPSSVLGTICLKLPFSQHLCNISVGRFWHDMKFADWGSLVDVVGYCFLNLGSKYQPQDEFVQWIQKGPKPIYIGFGSMVWWFCNADPYISFCPFLVIHFLKKVRQSDEEFGRVLLCVVADGFSYVSSLLYVSFFL